MPTLRVALAQLNPVVGDLRGNVERIVAAMSDAEAQGCDLLAVPELAITGYPPEDLLLRPSFVRDSLAAVREVVSRSGRCATVVGFVDTVSHPPDDARPEDGEGEEIAAEPWVLPPVIFNAAAVCAGGELLGTYRKRRLPNYSVFDEQRYFVPGTDPLELFRVSGVPVGISICEDAWTSDGPIADLGRGRRRARRQHQRVPVQRRQGARHERQWSGPGPRESGVALAYVNQVGGQDELIFDGDSMVVTADGEVLARAPQFVEGLFVVDVTGAPPTGRST